MSRNGAGTYNLPTGNPVVPATVISTTWANTTLNDMAAALTGSVAADGQTPVTGDLQMSSHKILALATCTAATDAANKSYVDAAIITATGSLGTMSSQNANNVAITGGTITGLSSPLPVASGGTGAATLTANNVLLGNGTSSPQFVAPSTSGYALRSTGTTWTSQKLGLGMTGEVWNTPSRVLGTTYTNSNGYPIMVAVSIGSSGVVGTNKYLTAYVNGSAVSQQVIYAAGNTTCSLSVIVPTGATYYFTDAGGSSQSISYWSELY
jgi:hypothetical protein